MIRLVTWVWHAQDLICLFFFFNDWSANVVKNRRHGRRGRVYIKLRDEVRPVGRLQMMRICLMPSQGDPICWSHGWSASLSLSLSLTHTSVSYCAFTLSISLFYLSLSSCSLQVSLLRLRTMFICLSTILIQCDQIGRFLNFLGNKFAYKWSPNI